MNKALGAVQCPLCDHEAVVLNERHPGYEEPALFSIAECCFCDVQFSMPMTPSESLYERIYEHAATLPGYSRYAWYAEQVKRRRNPLKWLASQEGIYAFIESELESRSAQIGRVVEVGSGLGYLTFALHRAGYDVRGFELSARAVAAARARFGDLYEVCDVTRVDAPAGVADAVILTEVLEHVADPCALLGSIGRMLKPEGIALITTPNKSAVPRAAYWQTDNPPVHFWWFSETAMRRMAERAGLTIYFPGSTTREVTPSLRPYFESGGRQEVPSLLVRKLLKCYPGVVLRIAARVRGRRHRIAQRLASKEHFEQMRVVLENPATRARQS